MAKCPVHRERTGSLSITAMGDGKTRLHCFGGCDQKAVLDALGLSWSDLGASSKPDPFWQSQRRLEAAERKNGLSIIMQAIEPRHRYYWAAVEKNTSAEIQSIRDRIHPEEARQREVQRILREYGIPELLDCLPEDILP
jgi:hypothetical protein